LSAAISTETGIEVLHRSFGRRIGKKLRQRLRASKKRWRLWMTILMKRAAAVIMTVESE
jgi:hypothetical protein